MFADRVLFDSQNFVWLGGTTDLFQGVVGDWDWIEISVIGFVQVLSARTYVGFILEWQWPEQTGGLDPHRQGISIHVPNTASAITEKICVPVVAPGLKIRSAINPAMTVTTGNILITAGKGPMPRPSASAPYSGGAPSDFIMAGATPNIGAGTTSLYSQISYWGRALVSGYVFTNAAGLIAIGRLYQIDAFGGQTELYYVQHPPGVVANSVQPFTFELPCRAQALRFDVTFGGGGAGVVNGACRILPFPYGA